MRSAVGETTAPRVLSLRTPIGRNPALKRLSRRQILPGAEVADVTHMSLLLILIILLVVLGGGGFYAGGPYVGGTLGGVILLVLLVMALTGRL